MSYGYGKPYVPVAKRRAAAEKVTTKAKKAGQDMHPVHIEGRTIAKTFWGKAWCDNLEAYSDFENRLPRGRTYVRNGSVIDLKLEPGKVRALVMGSSLYQIEIAIAAVPDEHWMALAKECTGSINSLVELLQGKLSKAVMERLCQPGKGLFPTPKDIQLDCSCPDWATMCKHVAAVLYGVGARLDAEPELLFTLRQVDASDLVTQAAELSIKTRKTPVRAKILDDALLADVFGIEMDSPEVLPATKKVPGARQRKAVEPTELVASTTKTPGRAAAAKKKPVIATAAEKVPPQARKSPTQTTAVPASAGKAASPAGSKRIAQQAAASMPAQTKKKKTPT